MAKEILRATPETEEHRAKLIAIQKYLLHLQNDEGHVSWGSNLEGIIHASSTTFFEEHHTIGSSSPNKVDFDIYQYDEGPTSYAGETSRYKEHYLQTDTEFWKQLVCESSDRETISAIYPNAVYKDADRLYEDGYGLVANYDITENVDANMCLTISPAENTVILKITIRKHEVAAQWQPYMIAIGVWIPKDIDPVRRTKKHN